MRLDVQCREEANNRFAQYVANLSEGDVIPLRSKFDPRAITDYLPHLILFELTSSNEIYERMVGTAVMARRGQTSEHSNVAIAQQSNDVTTFRQNVAEAAKHPCGFRTLSRQTYADGRAVLVEDIGFPLANKSGDSSLVVTLSRELPMNPIDEAKLGEADSSECIEFEFLDLGAGVPGSDVSSSEVDESDSDKRVGKAFAKLRGARSAA